MEAELWPGWRTLRKIGTGSFGVVYEIERDVFGVTENAALKIISIPREPEETEELRLSGYRDEDIRTRYESDLAAIAKEYSLMTKLRGHKNIVDCHDLQYEQNADGLGWTIRIKMELLTPILRNMEALQKEDEILRLGMDLCCALVHCKRQNIIHRDIKPRNILLDRDGNYKLGDFGIAKTANHTTVGTKTGSYSYMAPEVYNNQPYGRTADVYSLGLVLYWLLNECRLPFLPLPPQVSTARMEEAALERRFRGDEIPEPVHGSTALKRVVLKACAFDPAKRYADGEQMLKALEDVLRCSGEREKRSIMKTHSRMEPTFSVSPVENGWEQPLQPEAVQNQKTQEFTEDEIKSKRTYRRWISTGVVLCICVLIIVALLIGKKISRERHYQHGLSLMESGDYLKALDTFENLDGYKDSEDQIAACNVAIVNDAYENAVTLMNAGEYEKAIEVFEKLEDYQDSRERMNVCNAEIQYNRALSLMQAGEYTEAIKAFQELNGYQDSEEQIAVCNLEIQYNNAIALKNTGNVADAYEALIALDGYRDSTAIANDIYVAFFTEKYKEIKAGDCVTFGSYEQDSDVSNGKEELDWIVLEVQDGRALVISKYAIDCQSYHTSYTDTTWENSFIRRWLNDDFIKNAFSAAEEVMISTATVSADKNPGYTTDPGKAIQDKVFLLSIDEANQYFGSESARQCAPTAYAVACGAYIDSDNGGCWWWLRTPGCFQHDAAFVYSSGGVRGRGTSIDRKDMAIRPALWIDLSA